MESRSFAPYTLGGDHPVPVLLPAPDEVPARRFVGRSDLLARCQAAWFEGGGDPLHFRLCGPPGVGKNELVYELSRLRSQPLYPIQGHEELTPEDLACTARIAGGQRIEYIGSPLLAAMLRGGICFFDEIGKVPCRSLSLLASVLDDRRSITSVLAGFTVRAHPHFRFCAAMNDADAATSGLPGFVDERLRPAFTMGYPPPSEAVAIASLRHGACPSHLLDAFRNWASRQTDLSPRRAVGLLNYLERQHRMSGALAMSQRQAADLIAEADALFADAGGR